MSAGGPKPSGAVVVASKHRGSRRRAGEGPTYREHAGGRAWPRRQPGAARPATYIYRHAHSAVSLVGRTPIKQAGAKKPQRAEQDFISRAVKEAPGEEAQGAIRARRRAGAIPQPVARLRRRQITQGVQGRTESDLPLVREACAGSRLRRDQLAHLAELRIRQPAVAHLGVALLGTAAKLQ